MTPGHGGASCTTTWDDLHVVDSSFFRSIGTVSSALTAMVNAIRVGEHLTEGLS